MPQGHLRPVELVDAPLLVVQQPVVPQVDRVHAGRRRDQALEVVRRLPRPRGVLQRPLRQADQGADRHARRRRPGSPARRAIPSRTSAARWARATSRSNIRPCTTWRRASNPLLAFAHDRLTFLDPAPHRNTFLKPFHTRADAGVLLVVSQGAPRRARERLPLVPRLQRLRQLAGLGHLRRGRALLLLPAEADEVRRLPHAARAVQRSGGERTAWCESHRFPGAEYGASPSSTATRSS